MKALAVRMSLMSVSSSQEQIIKTEVCSSSMRELTNLNLV